jgi:zinc/manganese transport system substrate-binding protein
MSRSNSLKTILVACWFGVFAVPVSSLAEPVRVVATFSILGDMVQRIGGNRVLVTTLVGANSDPHVYHPTPTDARAVSEADIFFVNGMGFEGWLDRLQEAADFDGLQVTATEGVDAIASADEKHGDEEHGGEEHTEHHHGAKDPHAWHSLTNAEIYVRNIVIGMTKIDAAGSAYYEQNLNSYLAGLRALDEEIRSLMAILPQAQRTVVTSHDAFNYFGREYGLAFLAPLGMSTEAEASAKDVARLIEQIRRHDISAVFIENFGDPRLVQQIARETGAVVGGTLYPGALSDEDGPVSTYLDMMRHNANVIHDALKE